MEGFGWLLGNLEEQLRQPQDLLRALRLSEREPSMLGVSGHALAFGRRPN